MDLKHIKGIGEKGIIAFYQANIFSVEELLAYYPYRYQILEPQILTETEENTVVTINVMIVDIPKISYIRRNFNSLTFQAETYGKRIKVILFNRPYLKTHMSLGKEVLLIGKYNAKKNLFTANEIKFSKLTETKIIPVYHQIKGIKRQNLEKMIQNAFEECTDYPEVLPEEVLKHHHFLKKKDCLKQIHFPKEMDLTDQARTRIIYEELFEFMFKIQYLKHLKEQEIGIAKPVDEKKINSFLSSLPFKLTKDQQKGISDGLKDLTSNKRMNRLLLGDVGSGKTIVATTLMFANFLAGFQSAFLAPTEILAIQHFQSIRDLLKEIPVKIDLLVGSMTKKEKQNVLNKLQNNEIDILIGTHAMLNENLFFHNLGFIVTDEQHRFGVHQRDILKEKGNYPDMLFLSATPIPRTYALTIYGDMDTTMIKEKPMGRKDIETHVVKEADLKNVLFKVLEEIKSGHQIYVVAPMIEENEESDLKTVSFLKEKFDLAFHSKIPISTLHGKMKKQEKDTVMHDFVSGKTKILISTTVIEVGVDVKNATVMIIFNAERFGLATLHQLRGRVGRNDLQSYCYLICKEEKERLKVLEESNDGFYISEKDFEFRGEGDLFGVKQSGDMTFQLANLKRDYKILLEMKDAAEKFLQSKEYKNSQYYEKIIEKIDFTN